MRPEPDRDYFVLDTDPTRLTLHFTKLPFGYKNQIDMKIKVKTSQTEKRKKAVK